MHIHTNLWHDMQINPVGFFPILVHLAFNFFPFWVAVGSQGDAVRERLWTRLRNGAQGSNPLRGRGSDHAGSLNCWGALWFNVFMRSQKEKTKNFKSQIIKYLESLLQSQHQVSPRQKSWSWSRLQLTLGIPDKPTLQFPNLFFFCFLQLIKYWEAFLPEAKAIA